MSMPIKMVTRAARTSAKTDPQNRMGSPIANPKAELKIGPINGEMSIALNTTTAEFVNKPTPAMMLAHMTEM